jgi:hypothetical protein
MSSDRNPIWQQVVAKLQGAENQETEIMQPVVAQLGNHIEDILDMVCDEPYRENEMS